MASEFDHTELSDEQAALRVQKGDQEIFGVLMERYEAKLSRYGRKFLSEPDHIEDTIQDVFISAYQNIKSFRTSEKFSPWIYRIAHNAFVNTLKKNSHNSFAFLDLDTLVGHPVYEEVQELEKEQKAMQEMIKKSLAKIAPKYREVIVLHYFEEMGYKEIAEVLQVPTGTVGIRLKRAKEALEKECKDEYHHYGN